MTKPDKEPTDQDQANAFYTDYQALCQKYGFALVATPSFKLRDDGTFSLIIQTSVARTGSN